MMIFPESTERDPRERIRELERNLQDAYVTVCAIVAKYGEERPGAPGKRFVELSDADVERAERVPELIRVNDPDFGVAVTLAVRVDPS